MISKCEVIEESAFLPANWRNTNSKVKNHNYDVSKRYVTDKRIRDVIVWFEYYEIKNWWFLRLASNLLAFLPLGILAKRGHAGNMVFAHVEHFLNVCFREKLPLFESVCHECPLFITFTHPTSDFLSKHFRWSLQILQIAAKISKKKKKKMS